MSATTPALFHAAAANLETSLRAAGWDAHVLVVERPDGTIVAQISALASFHPTAGAFPTPALYSAQGEPLTTPAHPRAP